MHDREYEELEMTAGRGSGGIRQLSAVVPILLAAIASSHAVVDTAHARNLLQLNLDGPKKPRLWLRSYDYHYSLY
ncbi:hypothetical protein CPT34_23255 [Rhizobium sophoriradicis]|uniref:Uncharacterized protein n=2 Tax=Rhizobium/Agrobacterium group TaxID=227290 RepID=A0A2A5KNW0_9HYPH|nr:hypothetical protein Kim5_PC00436 [Rhizobium sp. Kim5]PCK78695.1 hypothetical protein CPT34_23255 [Rhizobium sophoriradicis]